MSRGSKKLEKSISFLLLAIFVLLTFELATARLVIPRRDQQHDSFFDSVILRLFDEIFNDSRLVHFVFQFSAMAPGKLGDKVVAKCSKFGTPMTLLVLEKTDDDDEDESAPEKNITEVYCESCVTKFQRVILVYEKLTSSSVDNLKSQYAERWDPGARFFILIAKGSRDEKKKIESLLRNFWSLDSPSVSVAILKSYTEFNKSGKIYSYDPFARTGEDRNKKGDKKSKRRGKMYEVKSGDALFPEKLRDLRGEEIETSIYVHRPHASLVSSSSGLSNRSTGLDVQVLRYISRFMNFRIKLRSGSEEAMSHVVSLPNGRKVGPIGDVLTGKSEYLANGQFLEVVTLYSRELEFIYPKWRSHSVIVVRRDEPLPPLIHWFKNIGGKATPEGRSSSFLPIFLTIVIGLGSLIIYFRLMKRQTGSQAFLTILGLFLFQRLPTIGNRASDRIFCLTWIYCCFVVCTVYQGHLVNDLTSPPVFDDINTLFELVERLDPLRLMVRPYEKRVLETWASIHNFDKTRKRLWESSFVFLNFSGCLSLLSESRNVACSIDQSFGEYTLGQVRRYQSKIAQNDSLEGNHSRSRKFDLPPIHIVQESLVDFWMTYFVRRGFPYLKLFDEALTRIVEFGLVDKWLRDDRSSYPPLIEFKEKPRSLDLLHMDYTFAILGLGHALAFLFFLGEYFIHKFRNTDRNFQLVDRSHDRLRSRNTPRFS